MAMNISPIPGLWEGGDGRPHQTMRIGLPQYETCISGSAHSWQSCSRCAKRWWQSAQCELLRNRFDLGIVDYVCWYCPLGFACFQYAPEFFDLHVRSPPIDITLKFWYIEGNLVRNHQAITLPPSMPNGPTARALLGQ